MQMKRCPNCKQVMSEDCDFCPECGTKMPKHTSVTLGNMRFTFWDIAFILVCNFSFVLIIVNVIVGGECWCHYPVLGMFAAYFLAFSCAAHTAKRFLTRFRNTIISLNFISGVFALICNSLGTGNTFWVFDYYIPISIIVACTTMLFLLLSREIYMRHVLLSILMLFVQSLTQFILMLCHVTANAYAPQILVSVAFGINVISLVNLVFLYMIKYKNHVVEKFRLWE